jgi:hypothetical protein
MDACLKHNVEFWWRGRGTFLIRGTGASTVIEDVESRGWAVIGLEGFELESTIIHPRLDLIYDADRAHRGGPAAVAAEWEQENVWIDMTVHPA